MKLVMRSTFYFWEQARGWTVSLATARVVLSEQTVGLDGRMQRHAEEWEVFGESW